MDKVKATMQETQPKRTKAQDFLEEWKRRRKEEEELFEQQLKDPAYRKMMEELQGKIVKNGKIVSTT